MSLYYVSTDVNLLNRDVVWRLLKDQFWCKDLPIEYVDRFFKHSLCFGVYKKSDNMQVGFLRVISDLTTYAYICDVVVDPLHRRKGLGTQLFDAALQHPDLQGLKAWSLRATPEARPLYESRGFSAAENPSTILERENLAIYTDPNFVNLHKPVTSCKTYSRLK